MKKATKVVIGIVLLAIAHLGYTIYKNPPGTATIKLKDGTTDANTGVPPSLVKNLRINGQYPAYRASPNGIYILGTGDGSSQILQVQVTGLKMAW